MRYTGKTWQQALAGLMMRSKTATIIVSIVIMVLGSLMMYSQTLNDPIPREEAVAAAGLFKTYVEKKNYRAILFEDGSHYDVYPHTERAAFRERMETLPEGTPLYLLVNPNNHFVAEIRTDTEELLNFESSQEALHRYSYSYIGIGAFMFIGGVCFLISIPLRMRADRRNRQKRAHKGVLRDAAPLKKGRKLLRAVHGDYAICYRRLKAVNELIVNGRVYDEYKSVIRFPHDLCARVDGHTIRAGYDGVSYYYITFDDNILAEREQII